MWRQLSQSLKITSGVLVIGGAASGASLADGNHLIMGLAGAALGATITLAAALHLVVRTADGRGVAARAPEAQPDSVEMQVWRDAASRACVDGLSVGSLVAVLCLWSPQSTFTQWLPLIALVVVAAGLGVRLHLGWRTRLGHDA